MEITVSSVDQVFNIVTSLVLMQIFQRLKPETTAIHILRALYFISQSFLLFLLYIVKQRIEKIDDKRTFEISISENETETISFSKYDKSELTKLLKTVILQIPIVLFLHFKFKLPQALAVQIITVIKHVFVNPLISTYLWRERFFKVKRPHEETVLFSTGETEEADQAIQTDTERVCEKVTEEVEAEKVSEKVCEEATDSESEKVSDEQEIASSEEEGQSDKKIEE